MIAVVDYGMGNLRSVEKGFQKVGVDVTVTSRPQVIDDAEAVVLPGVGAFRDCIRNLTDLSLTDAVVRSIQKGKPYLGICLGMQVLFSESEEFGQCRGLDIFRGKVVRFGAGMKVPHMGWNTVTIEKRPPVFDGIDDNSYFYFVHSFYVVPEDTTIISGTTDYNGRFTSMVWKDNVFATQFHPEKSQELGLKILKGFGEFVRKI
jgi:glutamine amidotransferase